MIYLASPYSHPDMRVRQERHDAVCRAAAVLMQNGHQVLSPIAHSHAIALAGAPGGWEFWAEYDKELIRLCEGGIAVLTLDGWQESVGVRAEIEFARSIGRTVTYVSWATIERLAGDVFTQEPEDLPRVPANPAPGRMVVNPVDGQEEPVEVAPAADRGPRTADPGPREEQREAPKEGAKPPRAVREQGWERDLSKEDLRRLESLRSTATNLVRVGTQLRKNAKMPCEEGFWPAFMADALLARAPVEDPKLLDADELEMVIAAVKKHNAPLQAKKKRG